MLHSQLTCGSTWNQQDLRINQLLEALFTSQQMLGKIVKEAKREFTKFLQDIVTIHKEEFLEVWYYCKRSLVGWFLFQVFPSKYLKLLFSNFAEALKMILTLSHEQASVEHGFNMNKSLLVENLQKALYILYDHSIFCMTIWTWMVWKLVK